MNKISINKKLYFLCGFFLMIIIGTNGFQTFNTLETKSYLENISDIQLPAVRKMSLIDMHHDGLVGVVYKAVYAAQVNDKVLLEETAKDLEDTILEFNTLLGELDALALSGTTKASIEDARIPIQRYLDSARAIISSLKNGQSQVAMATLVRFNEDFSFLETKLASLGDQIEKDSNAKKEEGHVAAEKNLKLSLAFAIAGIIFGVSSAVYIISALVKGISQTVEFLSASVHDVQNSSQVMIMVSRRLSTSVEVQATSITQSVTAMDEISSMIKNNNSSASNALTLSELTKNSAESGKVIVSRMQVEMGEISNSYDDIQASILKNKEDISKIVEVINQIAKKTEVINDIVFQTKLLSFNASVEAARAGASGKGFAVVAEEIGKLAVMSGDASRDIEKMLKDSQAQVKHLADTTSASITKIVDAGRDKIERGNDISMKCLVELEQILNYANDLDGSISEISGAIKEQSIGVEEVNLSMRNLNNISTESSELSDQSKSVSDNLKKQSQNLRSATQNLRQVLGSEKNYSIEPGQAS